MVFSSVLFLFLFLPITLLAYYVINPAWRNYLLLLASILFYAWGAPRFIAILIMSLFIDFIIGLLINRYNKIIINKTLLIICISINLGFLVYYKYINFFISEFNSLLLKFGLTSSYHWDAIILPIGISFVTFHKISYIVDVYRKTTEPFRNVMNYFLYILFFPQLIAGPIVRFHEIANQILSRNHTTDRFLEGIWRFSAGLGKKVLIANTLGTIADTVFKISPGDLNILTAWTGILFYTFQIYFDFSGYSDMAIGLGKMFGFELPENFNRPYTSKSITEFWRRWHMSLSRFFKDYLYIPLGGNRCSKSRNYFNLWIVFLLCGFWHGANWTFIAWGIYHGLLLIIDRLFLLNKLNNFPKYISNMITFVLVMIGWVFFRSDTINYAIGYIANMFNPKINSFILLVDMDNKVIITLLIAVILALATWKKENVIINRIKLYNIVSLKCSFYLLIFLYSCAILSTQSFNPFIYFKF